MEFVDQRYLSKEVIDELLFLPYLVVNKKGPLYKEPSVNYCL